MRMVIDIPDLYVRRWFELMERAGYTDFEQFVSNVLGIGIRTIELSLKFREKGAGDDKIIDFNSDYYWK